MKICVFCSLSSDNYLYFNLLGEDKYLCKSCEESIHDFGLTFSHESINCRMCGHEICPLSSIIDHKQIMRHFLQGMATRHHVKYLWLKVFKSREKIAWM